MLFRHLLTYGKFFASDGDGGGGSTASADGDDQDDGDNDAAADDTKDDDATAGLKSALEKERRTARDAAKQLKTLQKQFDDLTNAGKTEEERREATLTTAQKQATEAEERATVAETKLRDANARSAVTDAATTANAISVRAVYALVRDGLEFDDDGEPTNVDALIARAKKDEPSLFRASNGSADGGKTTTGNREVKPGMDRLTYAYETQSKPAATRRS